MSTMSTFESDILGIYMFAVPGKLKTLGFHRQTCGQSRVMENVNYGHFFTAVYHFGEAPLSGKWITRTCLLLEGCYS